MPPAGSKEYPPITPLSDNINSLENYKYILKILININIINANINYADIIYSNNNTNNQNSNNKIFTMSHKFHGYLVVIIFI